MDDGADGVGATLSRREISDAVGAWGWRYVLGAVCTHVRVDSLAQALDIAANAVAVSADDADGHLRLDARADCVVLTVQTLATASVTPPDIDLARRISAAVSDRGLRTDAFIADSAARSVQILEIAIDALDIAAIRPFWKVVMGYHDEVGASGPTGQLVDPLGQGPTVWFQQMDAPRPQRNRIHFDVSVPHDEATRRLEAALAAGGVLVADAHAPAFWVLADVEGNEVCITTWQGRDSAAAAEPTTT